MEESYIGQITRGVLPNIKGNIGIKNQGGAGFTDHTGAFYASFTAKYATVTGSSTEATGNAAFDAGRSSSVYGNGWFNGERVVPASVGMTYCIKY